jgi:hypothetical protein
VTTDIYTFRPKPEIADWIDEHIDSWTSFCYDNIYQQQRKNYQARFEKIGLRILIILLGMILLSFSLITINFINYLVIITGGICILLLGFTMLSLEVRNGRRR